MLAHGLGKLVYVTVNIVFHDSDIDGLDEYKTTEHELQESIKRALDMGWYNGNPNKFMNSPYLFGTDISSSAVLKEEIRRALDRLICLRMRKFQQNM